MAPRLHLPAAAVPVTPAVRRYAWGSVDALPALLGEAPDGQPVAELWFGSHPAGPATALVDGQPVGLDAFVQLPFMLKLIAAAEPLSIQVHPSAERAAARYAEETEAGVDPAQRRYQDPYAKPEVVCALTDFDALIDFRPVDDIAADFDGAGLVELAQIARTDGLPALVRRILTAEAAATETTVAALVAAGHALVARLAAAYPGDPGALIAMLLNHICLHPGEAAFLGPGTVHAYLGGTAVEVMSTSDNVLRAGLTAKLVDVDEFLAVARCRTGAPDLLRADASGRYAARAPQFALLRFDGADAREVPGPAVVVCTRGTVDVAGHTLTPGHAVFVPGDAGTVTVRGTGSAYAAVAGSEAPASEPR